jgi:tetratricopeptide (TPR) repeat protein
MRLPVSVRPSRHRFSFIGCQLAVGLACLGLACTPDRAAAQGIGTQNNDANLSAANFGERQNLHATLQWRQIQEHLPDPRTASAQILEQEADILRARRFPEDALEYYNYALARGGSMPQLLNKLGLTELEMRNIELARAYFKRSVKLNSRSADSWNNLGAVEYLDRGSSAAIGDYKHAIKLDKRQAVFHANLATAYFETRDYSAARKEMSAALKLDPGIFDKQSSAGGVEAHVLTAQDHARFAYEMARMYARNGQVEQMLHSLAMASEAGMDVQREMHRDLELAKFENDPRVVLLVHNAQMLKTGRAATVSASSAGSTDAAPLAAKPVAE